MTPLSYSGSGHEFPPDIIQRAVWVYLRFALSFRDVEELLVAVLHGSEEQVQWPRPGFLHGMRT